MGVETQIHFTVEAELKLQIANPQSLFLQSIVYSHPLNLLQAILCSVGSRGFCGVYVNKPVTQHILVFFLSPGSTSTRNSSQKGSSVLSIKQKSKRELYMEKLQEHLIKAKAFTIKK